MPEEGGRKREGVNGMGLELQSQHLLLRVSATQPYPSPFRKQGWLGGRHRVMVSGQQRTEVSVCVCVHVSVFLSVTAETDVNKYHRYRVMRKEKDWENKAKRGTEEIFLIFPLNGDSDFSGPWFSYSRSLTKVSYVLQWEQHTYSSVFQLHHILSVIIFNVIPVHLIDRYRATFLLSVQHY